MSAQKYKRNQKKCEEYRRSGRREINKAEKQKKHLARLKHFEERRKEGKTYQYKPPVDIKDKKAREAKNISRKTKIEQLDSLFGKLEYELNQKKLRAKEIAMKKAEKNKKNNF